MILSVSYESRDSADTIKYDAKEGDTLAAIVAAHPDRFKSWQDLALYNWGTDKPGEVNRALFETIGCSAIDVADPSKTVLKPHADAAKPKILLAKPFTADGLTQGKTYVMTVDKLRAPTAVSIDSLDRWFIPLKETCDLKYSLEGAKECAKRVVFEVHGSNYSAAGAYNRGLGSFPAAADKVDVALYTNEEQADAPERAAGQSVAAWNGKVTATDGALGSKNPKDGGGTEDRVVNAAFSPYTAHLRYFLDDADKDARLVLGPFWVQFDGAGAPVAASLDVTWNIRKTARLGGGKGSGQLRIVDGKGRLVFRKPLPAAQLVENAGGSHKFSWDGNYGEPGVTNSKGGTKAVPEDMPYRVSIEAHTLANEPKGLALAAMHTEVRLYVHPSTHRPDLDPYVVATDKSSLRLACSHDLLATRPVARGDGTLWCKHQLARGGFHPGPVNGDAGHAAYKLALTEFKRSVPARRAGPAADFQRFALDASEGDDVKDALEDLTAAPDWQRPWFGAPDGARADLDPAAATTRLNDPTQEVILWVDDRHTYTDPDWLAGVAQGPTTRNKVKTAPAATADHMGGYATGDAMVDKKAKSIPRPWIPLAADLVLLGKADDLDKELPLPGDGDLKLMRKAIGPLRVDWTFQEIDADPPDQTQVDVAQYDKGVTRSRAFAKNVLGALKATHARKDVKQSAVYHNCPENAGGIRPSAAATYYKKAFALGADSLRPWEAVDASGREAVATIVHDNLGQAADDLVAGSIGRAGVYFHPSTIAGDGYRVRAQVQFAAQGDYKLPNLAVLKARYPRLPQAHSAALRLWRKASVRAFVCWSDRNDWAATKDATFKMFEPGFLHFVFERGNAGVDGKVTDHLADDNAFKALVREALAPGAPPNSPNGRRALAGAIKLTEKRLWPWHDDSQFGLYEPSAPNAALGAAVSALLSNPINPLFFTLSNLFGLALVNQLESKKGRLRGHVIVQMRCSDPLYMQQYRCATCNKKYYYAESKRLGGAKRGQPCPTPACAGTLAEQGAHFVGHYTCTPNNHKGAWEEPNAAGGSFTGAGCVVAGCGGTLNPDQVQREQYTCSVCATNIWLEESGAGGSHDGEPCRQAGCAGVLAHTGSVFKEKYKCDACNLLDEKVEPASAGGSFVGQPHATCAHNPKGALQRQAPPAIGETHTITAGNKVDAFRTQLTGYGDSIPVPSLGNPLGVAWNFAGDHELWAHETAHTRHMEHAGNAPGANNAQHDPVNNTGFNWAAINETTADGQHWDRACLMTYASHRASYNAARDKVYPCGRCSLKLRGWKLAGVAAPGSAVKDP